MTKANFLRRGRLILLLLLVGLKAVSIARGLALDVRIVNSNPDFPDAKVFLMFGGIASGLDATATVNGAANTKLVEGVSYALSQISDIKLTSFRRGRIYISLGSKLASASAAMAFNPNFSNPSLPDYNTRWDKVEITYSPGDPGSGANLSASDFFSVPLQLNTFATANPDTPSTTLTWRAPTATTFSRLADLSGGNTVAVARGSNGLRTQGYGQVVRIISPSTVANPSVYSSFAPYVDFVKSQELMTLIRGSHSASQSYSFKAVVDKSGNLVMTGTVTGVPVAETTITIASQDLLNGIYTCNPRYTVNGNPHDIRMNDPYATAVRDVLCGFILGFVGSTEINPNTGDSFGAGPSDTWYEPPVPVRLAFAGAQPANSNYYNQYAGYLSTVSDAYAFPFTDLIQKPFASLNPSTINAMTIVILPDTGISRSLVPATSSQAPKPVPDQKQITSFLEVRNQPNMPYSNITLRIKIDHPAIGDLSVKLRSPQGRTFLLHNQTQGETDDLHYVGFALPSPQINNPNGTWTLTISDHKKGNVGTLVDWELSFPETSEPEKDRRSRTR